MTMRYAHLLQAGSASKLVTITLPFRPLPRMPQHVALIVTAALATQAQRYEIWFALTWIPLAAVSLAGSSPAAASTGWLTAPRGPL